MAAIDDVIIIGGGHNGLVCAAYLAGAGLKVRVLERRGIVGGAAVTEEFHPGFRNSVASYTVSLLNPRVIADLRLAQHGLRVVERPYSNFLPLPDGRAFRLGGEHGLAEVAKWSARDAERLPLYYAMLERVVAVLRELMLLTPPNVSAGFVLGDWLASAAVARRLGRLDMRGRRDLLDLFTKSAGELLDHWFEGEPLKAALGWDSVVGNFASPYTPGSAYVLLHHVFGEVNGRQGAWGHAIGGMGAITQAMAAECAARGVVVETGAEVAQVLVEGGRAVGVALADGRTLRAKAVAGNVNPKRCAVSSSRCSRGTSAVYSSFGLRLPATALARSVRPSASATPTARPPSTSTSATSAPVSTTTPRAAHSAAIACVIAPMPPMAWPQAPWRPLTSPNTWCSST